MAEPKIFLSIAHPSGKEKQYVAEAIDSNWITTQGPQIDKFENDLSFFLGTKKPVVALSSGTAAIHLGLIQLGIQPGDEVICQDMTFVASVNPVRYLGANPVLVDSEWNTWNLSPEKLQEAIDDRIKKTGKTPKAIIPVDLYGMPAQMPEILRIASKYKIPVLEDAAEALGSYIDGSNQKQYCGTFGDSSCLSFNGNKIITTSGGGALICRDEFDAAHVRFLATQARDKAPYYQHSEMGYNYRLSNVCAAIGRAQMEALQTYVNRRRAIHFLYKKELSTISGLEFQDEPAGYYSNYWLTCVLFSSYELRESVRKYLESKEIETRPLWKPMHLQPLYSDASFYGTGINQSLFDRGLCLPSGSILKDEDILRVCAYIKDEIQKN